jgi:hypothetical protein
VFVDFGKQDGPEVNSTHPYRKTPDLYLTIPHVS